jgi:hypothetical protein
MCWPRLSRMVSNQHPEEYKSEGISLRGLYRRIGNRQLAANPPRQVVSNFTTTGTASAWPVCGFSQSECSLPSRRNTQPWRRRCRSRPSRFIRPRRVPEPHRVAERAGTLPSVLKNQGNRLTEACQAFFVRLALTVRAGHLGAVCDVPRTISFNDCRELVAHVYILPSAPLPALIGDRAHANRLPRPR